MKKYMGKENSFRPGSSLLVLDRVTSCSWDRNLKSSFGMTQKDSSMTSIEVPGLRRMDLSKSVILNRVLLLVTSKPLITYIAPSSKDGWNFGRWRTWMDPCIKVDCKGEIQRLSIVEEGKIINYMVENPQIPSHPPAGSRHP